MRILAFIITLVISLFKWIYKLLESIAFILAAIGFFILTVYNLAILSSNPNVLLGVGSFFVGIAITILFLMLGACRLTYGDHRVLKDSYNSTKNWIIELYKLNWNSSEESYKVLKEL